MILVPELLYQDGRFVPGQSLTVDDATGVITRVGSLLRAEPADAGAAEGPDIRPDDVVHLPGKALMPGFVNAHSHAFQRLIRGRTHWKEPGPDRSDFWNWREAMYRAALPLEPEDVHTACCFCFGEMLRAGITTVAEFHYLHRDRDGRRYADRNEMAWRVLAAAEDVGIRIVLLNVCYATGEIGGPLRPEQQRFTSTLDGYLARTEALATSEPVRRPTVSVGVAPHSIRAVPRDWLPELHGWAEARDMPFHMHVSEQPAEVEACREAFGVRPVELLDDDGLLDERLTAVHATHLTEDEVSMLGQVGAMVCACPTTERDLGDGFLPGRKLLDAGAGICLGTDSHAQIDPFDEMRLLEHHERLRRLERVVMTGAEEDGELRVAPVLLDAATAQGARSLRLSVGSIEPGRLADLVAIDLEHRALAGTAPDVVAEALALAAPPDVVTDVWVGGERRVEDRRLPGEDDARRAFDELSLRLFPPRSPRRGD